MTSRVLRLLLFFRANASWKLSASPLVVALLVVGARPSHAMPTAAVLVEETRHAGLYGKDETTVATAIAIESALENALASSGSVRVITRSRLENILQEQGLAYENIVNDRARLGGLIGADFLVISSLLKNDQTKHRETVAAYGLRETQTTFSSAAALNIKMLDVGSGSVLAQRLFTEEMPQSLNALDRVLLQAGSWLRETPLAKLPAVTTKHAVKVEPKSQGRIIRGLDVVVDGNFVANSPVTLQLESGVRNISLIRAGAVVWSNRVKVTGEIVVEPELFLPASAPN